jgi:hypothetical protein
VPAFLIDHLDGLEQQNSYSAACFGACSMPKRVEKLSKRFREWAPIEIIKLS